MLLAIGLAGAGSDVPRTLIAGFGNTLRGDDGFGIEVLRRLADQGTAAPGVDLMEVGTAGIRLAQELLTPCDLLIIADAMTRGGEPGTVYVLEVDAVEEVQRVDMHVAIPSHALSVAQALNVLPPRVVLVGCEPMQVDEMTCELTGELTPPVRAAVDVAVRRIHHLLAGESSLTIDRAQRIGGAGERREKGNTSGTDGAQRTQMKATGEPTGASSRR